MEGWGWQSVHDPEVLPSVLERRGSIRTAEPFEMEFPLRGGDDRFWLLARQPRMGRRRPDLSPGLRSFAAGDYVVLYTLEDDDAAVLIHYVFHGSQDIESFFQPLRDMPLT
jgi:hypothetical protein